jgi:flagellar biosynthesis/type III secretory pathway protein FliH
VVYTDDAIWRKPVSDHFWYAFDSRDGKQYHRFDVIKIKTEKSRDLIRQHSLLCKMLALKADDRGIEQEELIREIYQAAAEMKDVLSEEHLLLLEQWVNAYKKVSEPMLKQIKKEIGMEFIATTISEHIFHEGLLKGKAEGEAKGKAQGEIEGQIKMLDIFHQLGLVLDEQYQLMIQPLQQQLAELTDNEPSKEPS